MLQWLLNAETSHPTSSPPHRLTRFFTTLHSALRNPSRAVLQFYPSSDDQVQLITSIAQRAGFGGGVVVDYPNSKKARKVFLCLFVGDAGGGGGGGPAAKVPEGLQGDGDGNGAAESEDANAKFERRRQRESRRERSGKQKVVKGGKDWILRKKEVRDTRKIRLFSLLIESSSDRSCIEGEERKVCRTTPSTPVAKEGQFFRDSAVPLIPSTGCHLLAHYSAISTRKNESLILLYILSLRS